MFLLCPKYLLRRSKACIGATAVCMALVASCTSAVEVDPLNGAQGSTQAQSGETDSASPSSQAPDLPTEQGVDSQGTEGASGGEEKDTANNGAEHGASTTTSESSTDGINTDSNGTSNASETAGSTTTTEVSDTTDTTKTTAPDDKDGRACENAGFRCLDRAPADWRGPIRLSHAKEKTDLEVCAVPNNRLRNAVDSVSGEPAECKGCTAYPTSDPCPPLRLQYYFSGTECKEGDEHSLAPLGNNTCEFSRKGLTTQAFKIVPAGPNPVASCFVYEEGQETVPEPEMGDYFRGCFADVELSCQQPSQRCLDSGTSKACIYREGEHECPSGTYNKKTQLYGSIDDRRSCGACEPKSDGGPVYCSGGYTTTYGKYDCGLPKQAHELTPRYKLESEGESPCVTAKMRESQEEWDNFYVQQPVLRYGNRCSTDDWGTQGEVKGADPVTICCEAD